MIVLISGTNRENSNTSRVTELAREILEIQGEQAFVVDLTSLPPETFTSASYERKPEALTPIQDAILAADGILTVVPEYNGSFPGALKYFIDLLRFPESLVDKPAGFIGVAAGRWGALRPVEQLEMVFQYRHAHIFGRRLFLPGIHNLLDSNGRLSDPDSAQRLHDMVTGFVDFCRKLKQ